MMNCWPISRPKIKPEQAASISNAAARRALIFCCTMHAVEGNRKSGVIVALNVTELPYVDVFSVEVTAVVVDTGAGDTVTVG